MNLRRAARTALIAPIMIASGLLVMALGSTDVLAASTTGAASAAPQSSSRPHKHERVECSPGRVPEKNGQCAVVFVDPKTKTEKDPVGDKVCFTVSPAKAGHVATGSGNCAHVGKSDRAFGTFATSGKYCGNAQITALEAEKGEQAHHTTVNIVCTPTKKATTTAAALPTGGTQPPIGSLILGVLGVSGVIGTAFALKGRRWIAPWRLTTGPSA